MLSVRLYYHAKCRYVVCRCIESRGADSSFPNLFFFLSENANFRVEIMSIVSLFFDNFYFFQLKGFES